MEENKVEMVSLAAYESQGTSFRRIIKWLIMGWAISMVAMGLVLVISMSYTEDVVTETTTETYERYAQADNQGNAIIGDGDNSIGDSTYNANGNGNEDDQNDETGSSVPDTDQPA